LIPEGLDGSLDKHVCARHCLPFVYRCRENKDGRIRTKNGKKDNNVSGRAGPSSAIPVLRTDMRRQTFEALFHSFLGVGIAGRYPAYAVDFREEGM
jgi:hypothetical protein